MLKIFNTLTKNKEEFISIVPNVIQIYVCGATVYDLCHIGHGRVFVIFDTIVRYLRYCGYQVNYVRNITDIDDKIIQKSLKNQKNIQQFTQHMIQEMHTDLDALNILRPDYEPKATEHINTIIKLINLLIMKKYAYITSDRNVMFSIKTAPHYGVLSNQKIKVNEIHDTINACNIVQSSADFVLWKASKLNEPSWISPWGEGRPGWHIECSAMSYAILGKHLDIHGGGSDLIFPHHENEIAQSVCAHDIPYAKIWMHVGMLLLNYKKMSKSLNNFFTIRDILQHYDPETIRFFLMSTHYRKPLQYSNHALKQSRKSLERLYIALRDTGPIVPPKGGDHFISEFISKMNDDFNIPEAYTVLFNIAHQLNCLKSQQHPNVSGIAATLRHLANILGLLYQNPENFLQNIMLKNNKNYNLEMIQELIKHREYARKKHQWTLADKIREQLNDIGIILEDHPSKSTKWRFHPNFIDKKF